MQYHARAMGVLSLTLGGLLLVALISVTQQDHGSNFGQILQPKENTILDGEQGNITPKQDSDVIINFNPVPGLSVEEIRSITSSYVEPTQLLTYVSGLKCPLLSAPIELGDRDKQDDQTIRELQIFLVSYFNLESENNVTGFFGPITLENLNRFREEFGLTPSNDLDLFTTDIILDTCDLSVL